MAPPPAEPTGPRLKWHVVYYFLAAFDILTVSASLYLNDRVMDMYVQSVATSQEWGQLLADYTAMEQLAGDVNATGNDVFESADVGKESQRLQVAQAAFRERIAALRKDLLATAPSQQGPALVGELDALEAQTLEMAAGAREVLELFAQRDRNAAARRMAAMDRQYAKLLDGFRGLRARFAQARSPRPVRAPEPEPGTKEPRWQRFERQTSAAASMQRWEFVIAALIVVMVTAAVVYGRVIARHMERDAIEKARYIQEINEAREHLEQRVLERTEALLRSEEDLRRAASEWQQTFEAIESPVVLLDLEGRVLRANRAAGVACGGASTSLGGRPVASLGDGEPWRAAAEIVGRLEGPAGVSLQTRDATTGRTWDVSANLVGGDGSDQARAIVVARDVTRTVELQEIVRREEKMAAMGGLVAGVAHEVRNPLFGISATLDAFDARHGKTESFEKYLGALRRDVGRLQTLMHDLLEYGRPARLDLAPTHLDQVVAEALRACEPMAKDLLLVKDVPSELPPVLADRERLVQVFQNLVQNAAQHAATEGRIVVRAGTISEGPRACVWCSVRDSGPGFRLEDLPRLFEPFFTRRPGGTGLGLSIAQRIVEQHGGAIRAENDPSGGAIVTVTLPVAA